jgi:hypothetical protein
MQEAFVPTLINTNLIIILTPFHLWPLDTIPIVLQYPKEAFVF